MEANGVWVRVIEKLESVTGMKLARKKIKLNIKKKSGDFLFSILHQYERLNKFSNKISAILKEEIWNF